MRALVPALCWILAFWSCKREIVPQAYVPTGAHDAYRHGLSQAELDKTALGRDWAKAAEFSLRSATEIDAPFTESFYVDSTEAFAIGYRFAVKRGQRTEVKLEIDPPSDWRIFLDLFRAPEAGDEVPEPVATGGEGDLRLAFEPRQDGIYLLRVQSELLRGGSCTLIIRNVASLEFPVAGMGSGAIRSPFGVPREGGRRVHHGVDIFAPRGTEVLATSRARVRRVGDRPLGGRVIWLEDPERGLYLYFAHLDTQDVVEGTWVAPGDRIGTVGNTGNARTTPPHLHFGIYPRGERPIDPFPFLSQPAQTIVAGRRGSRSAWRLGSNGREAGSAARWTSGKCSPSRPSAENAAARPGCHRIYTSRRARGWSERIHSDHGYRGFRDRALRIPYELRREIPPPQVTSESRKSSLSLLPCLGVRRTG